VAARVIWDKKRNPTRHVSDCLGVERWQLRQAIHKIKKRNHLKGADRTKILSDGTVTDEDDETLGNVFDEI
jgi:hypothetical protein